jgi:hypothetical protein
MVKHFGLSYFNVERNTKTSGERQKRYRRRVVFFDVRFLCRMFRYSLASHHHHINRAARSLQQKSKNGKNKRRRLFWEPHYLREETCLT